MKTAPRLALIMGSLVLCCAVAIGEEVAVVPANPNLLFDLSVGLLDSTVAQDVNQVGPVTDVILKTRISGTGHTIARTRVELIPNNDRATLEFVVQGHSYTDTVGVNGPVKLYTNAVFPFESRQRVFLDAYGVYPCTPNADTHGSTQLRCLATKYGCLLDMVVRKIALGQYKKNQQKAQAIADSHAEEKYIREMEKESGPQFEELKKELDKSFGDMKQYGIERSQVRLSTTAAALHFTVAGGHDPLQSPPPLPSSGSDMNVRTHESIVHHFGQLNLAGKTLTGEQLDRLLNVKKSAKDMDEETPWSITFDKSQPVAVRFRDKKLATSLKITEFTSDEDVYSGMNVTVQYAFEETPSGFVAQRQGRLDIFPIGFTPGKGEKLSARQQAMRTVLEKRLNKVFKERVDLEVLNLPGDLRKAGPLAVTAVDPQDGWLSMAWKRTKR